MAFRQPQRQQQRPSNTTTFSLDTQTLQSSRQLSRDRSPSPEPREWILFSPNDASDSYQRTESTIHTVGRLSDFGSLDTRAGELLHPDESTRNADAETEDLDSLDDGLHEFSEHLASRDSYMNIEASRDTVLPAHDGLGMFPPGDSSPLQDQLWQHERYNPRRRRLSLRRSSIQRKFDVLEEEKLVPPPEDEKTQRIEQWRMEQSKAILEEIEKETSRRKRRSRAGNQRLDETPLSKSAPEKDSVSKPSSRTARLSFWERITRRVIRDLIGIDDATLEYIFGESLPEEPPAKQHDPSAASAIVDYAEQAIPDDHQLTISASSWEERLLARISKELGILLNHISEHPGAFSTYLRTQEIPPYAGITPSSPAKEHPRPRHMRRSTEARGISSNDDPKFVPTLGHHHHRRHSVMTTDPSLWGIEEEDEGIPASLEPSEEAERIQREKEYWERDLDVKMVFSFLRNKLTSSSSTNHTPAPSPPPEPVIALTNQHDSLRRAALIRHHHPLVSRNVGKSALVQRPVLQNRLSSGSISSNVLASGAPLSPILGRRSSRGAETESCASQSTKRSRTGRSGSSRNYWDLGGRSDGASGTWSAGWGEV